MASAVRRDDGHHRRVRHPAFVRVALAQLLSVDALAGTLELAQLQQAADTVASVILGHVCRFPWSQDELAFWCSGCRARVLLDHGAGCGWVERKAEHAGGLGSRNAAFASSVPNMLRATYRVRQTPIS